jgi:hypothetical protein
MPRVTASFASFPDDTVLGPSFMLSGFTFQDLGSVFPSFVNQASGTFKGLQFERTGLRIRFPRPSALVELRAGAFAGAFRIEGKDSSGNLLAVALVPGDNAPHDIRLFHPGMFYVDCVGGGNEGVIELITAEGAETTTGDVAEPEPRFAKGRVSGLDVHTGAGALPLAFAFITDDDGNEIQVQTTSLQLLVALSTATATEDCLEVTYVSDESAKLLTRVRFLDRGDAPCS